MPKPLNIRSFLPQREIEICQRVRQLRLSRKMEQTEFAQRLRISRSRLSSYEYAKAPIKYEFGKEICYRFGVSQKWLALGEGPRGPYFDISPNLEFRIPSKSLFSAAFDEFLRTHIEEREQELKKLYGEEVVSEEGVSGDALDNFHLVGENPAKAAAFYVKKAVLLRLQWLPPELQIEYANAIIDADAKFQKRFGKRISELLPPEQRQDTVPPSKESLTSVTLKGKHETMKSEMQKLMDRVKRKASQPGAKAQLARELAVAPARISEWLHGDKEPGGEYTLRLLKWVES